MVYNSGLVNKAIEPCLVVLKDKLMVELHLF